MSKKKHFFVMAGEPSGDLHGASLIHALKKEIPDSFFCGVSGPRMRAEGTEEVLPMEKFAVMGFTDVLKAFPRIYKQFYLVRDHILKTQPDCVIFIDYPGFNLRLAKALRKKGYSGKLVHYICPSVWAWGKKRIAHMATTLDLLLTIYPFEAKSFAHTSLSVKYIGNPLQEYINRHAYNDNWKDSFSIDGKTLISIFPGSRLGEIHRNLPIQLEAAALFQQFHPDTAFGISSSNETNRLLIQHMIDSAGLKNAFTVPKEYTYELMRDSHSAIAKSGTVTLELALHKRPTIVVYALSTLNWLIAKFIIRLKLPHYCIVNILNGKRVFAELIEEGFNAKNLVQHLENIHSGAKREDSLYGCQNIIKLFQNGSASRNGALVIKELLP